MNFIYNIPKAYPKKSCNKLIDWFEANINIAAPGMVGDKKLNDLEINLQVKHKEDYFGLGKTLIKGIKKFKKNFPHVDKYIRQWSLNSSMQLMKYKPNKYYNIVHCENDGDSKYLKRVFAFMIFLNDIEKGGGTKFIYQNFVAKPKAGDFYIWPAYWTHLHQGVNAPKENKYIITGWIEYVH
jgi:prolyl 4-hydroxylase